MGLYTSISTIFLVSLDLLIIHCVTSYKGILVLDNPLYVTYSIYLFLLRHRMTSLEWPGVIAGPSFIACYLSLSNMKYPDKKIIFRGAKSSVCDCALTSEALVNCNIDSKLLNYKS